MKRNHFFVLSRVREGDNIKGKALKRNRSELKNSVFRANNSLKRLKQESDTSLWV